MTTEIEVAATGSIDNAPPVETVEAPVVTTNVPDTTAAPEPEEHVSPRERAMRSIVERAEAHRRSTELAYGEQLADEARAAAGLEPLSHEEPEPAEPREPPEPANPNLEADAAPQVQQPVPTHQPVDKITLEINGQPVSLTPEEYRQLATMGAEAAFRQQPQVQQPIHRPTPQAQPVAPQAPVADPEMVRRVVKQIAYGQEDEGVKALSDLISSVVERTQAPAQPMFDPNALVNTAANVAQARMQLQSDLMTIGREFPELFGADVTDPALAQLAAFKLNGLRAKYAALQVSKPELALYREACSEVRDLIGKRDSKSQPEATGKPTAQAVPIQVSQDKVERKRAAPKLPASAGRRASLGEDARAPTGSQVVDWMRKSRGQAAMN